MAKWYLGLKQQEVQQVVQQVWEGERSTFPWEQEGLDHIKNHLNSLPIPYYARQCFSFTSPHGAVRECDLLIAVPAGFFLIELKAHRGRAYNSGSSWKFQSDGAIDNPLHATDLKAKELKGLLRKSARQDKVDIPFLGAAVFLSAPNLVCDFDDFQLPNVYGREGLSSQTNLDEIVSDLLNRAPRPNKRTPQRFYEWLPKLLKRVGVAEIRSERRIGQYVLEPKALESGPTWMDYLVTNPTLPEDQPRRARVYVLGRGTDAEDLDSMQRAAKREYTALVGIDHPGIVSAESFGTVEDLGPGVVFTHGKNWQRLHHFMNTDGKWRPLETRVAMIRQLADALRHAHGQRLYHRALAASSVWVELDGEYPRLRIADWQGAARRGTDRSGTSWRNVVAHIGQTSEAYLAPEAANTEADPIQLDVFGLGALAYLILTGIEPADSRQALSEQLKAGGALIPSAISDEMTPAMDALLRGATSHHSKRFQDVAGFLWELDEVETEVLSQYDEPEPDPLTAKPGDLVGGYQIIRVLGSGSTGKALLAKDTDNRFERHTEVVLKVARADDAGAQRALEYEAQVLRPLRGTQIIELLAGPIELGGRTVLVEAVAGQESLGQYLRREGRLTSDELKGWGSDLFAALRDLEHHVDGEVRHRDIKPDNLGVRDGGNKKRRQLILFDFSLALTDPKNTQAGTRAYLDPFLGTPRRGRYDAAAEYYAAAVTLYEMATTELPSWGDGLTDPAELPDSETVPQIRSGSFEPSIADGLKSFFLKALHRDAGQRFGDRDEMEDAFRALFRADSASPPTKPEPSAAQSPIVADLPLSQAGLSAKALAAAHDRLKVDTVGEFVEKPGTDINRLRGVGTRVRNELQQKAAEWRAILNLAETALPLSEETNSPITVNGIAADLARVKGDEEYRRCVHLLLGLPDGNQPSPVHAWAPLDEIGAASGLTPARITQYRNHIRDNRWEKLASLNALRDLLPEILDEHGRIMAASRLATAVLVRLGASLADPDARMAAAGAAVYGAVTVEDNKAEPRYVFERQSDGSVVVALSGGEDPNPPTERELIDYASALGLKAVQLVKSLGDTDPLPQSSEVAAMLHSTPSPDGLVLPDTDLVRLAADVTKKVAATPRLELYPTDLDPKQVVAHSELDVYLNDEEGVRWQDLISRAKARFAEVDSFPNSLSELLRLLGQCGLDVRETGNGRLRLREHLRTSSTSRSRQSGTGSGPADAERFPGLLETAAKGGGFRAIKTGVGNAWKAAEWLAHRPQVQAVDVQALFLRLLREYVAERGHKPSWQTVLRADTVPAPGPLVNLLAEVWKRLDAELGELTGDKIVFLYNSTPLARYSGGQSLLHKLTSAARLPGQWPHGLWLLCPTDSPRAAAHLDGYNLGAVDAAGEQLTFPTAVLSLKRHFRHHRCCLRPKAPGL